MTVNRRLLEKGYWVRRPVKKPKLIARHKGRRLRFERQHHNFIVHHRRHVFGDESRFLLHHVHGRVRVSWLRGEALHNDPNDCVMFNQTGGGGSVHVWGAIHHDDASDSVVLDRNVPGVLYQDILDQNLIPFARQHFQDNFRYQDDNAPEGCARVLGTGADPHPIPASTITWLQPHWILVGCFVEGCRCYICQTTKPARIEPGPPRRMAEHGSWHPLQPGR